MEKFIFNAYTALSIIITFIAVLACVVWIAYWCWKLILTVILGLGVVAIIVYLKEKINGRHIKRNRQA